MCSRSWSRPTRGEPSTRRSSRPTALPRCGTASRREGSSVRAVSVQDVNSHGGRVTRALSVLLVAGVAGGLVVFASLGGTESLVSALTRVTWWQFLLVCAVYGVGVIADTRGELATTDGAAPRPMRR